MDTYAITEFFNYDLAAEYYAESTDYPDSTGIEVDYIDPVDYANEQLFTT